VTITFQVDSSAATEKLDRYVREMGTTIQMALKNVASKAMNNATSRARESLKNPAGYIRHLYKRLGDREVIIGNDHKAAWILEFGSKPHRITPKSARALKIYSGGEASFLRRVEHPGTRPRLILHSAITPREAIECFSHALRELL